MKITKLGHCCLLIEVKGRKILTDPGVFSTGQDQLKDIDLLVITHEHQDHLHTGFVTAIIRNNPQMEIWTNSSVAAILRELGVKSELFEDGMKKKIGAVSIEGFGKQHAEVFPGLPRVENTGLLIDGYLFYPGDALTVIKPKVKLLALPVTGPWLKMSEAINYALEQKPVSAFPVHDGLLKSPGAFYPIINKLLAAGKIDFIPLAEGDSTEEKA